MSEATVLTYETGYPNSVGDLHVVLQSQLTASPPKDNHHSEILQL